MFKFFKKKPLEAEKKQYRALLGKAMQAQRSGDIRTYSELMSQANDVLEKIQQIEPEFGQ